MSKRIYFILLPVIAILFSIVCGQANSLLPARTAKGLSITTTSVHNDTPVSSGVKKENKHRLKNAIRIKAWDDAAAMTIVSAPAPVLSCLLFTKVVYGGYRLYGQSAHCSTSGSRGPPVA